MSNEYQDIETTIRDYISGSLPEDERAEFEAYFMSNPEVAEMVQGSLDMQFGLMEKLTQVETVEQEKGAPSSVGFIQKIFDWLSVPVPVYAPLFVLVAMSGFFSSQKSSEERISEFELIGFKTEPSRGLNDEGSGAIDGLKLNLNERDKYAAILLKIHRNDVFAGAYQATLTGESGDLLWQSGALKPDGLRDVLVVLPPILVDKGVLSVRKLTDATQADIVKFCHYSEVCN